MIQGYKHPKYGLQKPLRRTRINAQVKRIRRMFKWAIENELASTSVHQALCAVAPLKRGRTQSADATVCGAIPSLRCAAGPWPANPTNVAQF